MSVGEVALVHLADRIGGAVAELRREAVSAVVRQRRLREELSQVQAEAALIEERASRALRRKEDTLARRILARGISTLKTRDALEEEIVDARRRVSEILTALVRAENRAWNLPRRNGRAPDRT